MAHCPKCGKHIKRRKGAAKCRHCGPLPAINGRAPQNPYGSCFDSAGHLAMECTFPKLRVCHAIGIANAPGIEGERIAHAWIEFYNPKHGMVAVDPIYLVGQPANEFRANFKPELVCEYQFGEFLELWKLHNYPGPWHPDIIKYTKERKAV